jgi:predicted transcriptional regulator
VLEAREMYDELDVRGKRRYTLTQIAGTVRVSRKTIYRHLDRDEHRTG